MHDILFVFFCYCTYVELIEIENKILSINDICITGSVTRQPELSGASWL